MRRIGSHPLRRRAGCRGARAGRLAAIARSPAICARICTGSVLGDYFAMLAYLAVSQAHTDVLQAMRPRCAIAARRHLPGVWSPIPPFDRSSLQRRPEHGSVPPDHVRRRHGPSCARAKVCRSAPPRPLRQGATSQYSRKGDRRVLRVHLGADVEAGLAVLQSTLAAVVEG